MKNKRILQDGSEVESHDGTFELKVITKCPEKWKLVDLETGEEFTGLIPVAGQLTWKRIKGRNEKN